MLDFTKCSLCGSCVEACRDGAIRYSHEYNLASTNKEDYIMDLFQRLENERLEAERVAQASSPAGAVVAQASPPAGSPGVSPGVPPVSETLPNPSAAVPPNADQPKPASPTKPI
jgi:ferredoxin